LLQLKPRLKQKTKYRTVKVEEAEKNKTKTGTRLGQERRVLG
jgi:hypothetical protein